MKNKKKIRFDYFCENCKIGTKFRQQIDKTACEFVICRIHKNSVYYKRADDMQERSKIYKADFFDLFFYMRYGTLRFDFLE